MAYYTGSIYGGTSDDFLKLYTAYRNKQRLAGQPLNPNDIGAMADAALQARYTNQDNKRKLSLYEKFLTDAQTNADRNYGLEMQKMGIAEDAQKAQEKQGLYGAAGNIIPAIMGTYGFGKEMGWWGGDKASRSIYTPGASTYDYSGIDPAESTSIDMGVFSPPGSYGENAGSGQSGSGIWDVIKNWLF